MPSLTFVFPWILAAGAAVAIPIIIHLRMRQKPRLQVFPAMRFLQKSLVFNTARLRIRHWLLLATRMAMLALLAVLIARPVLPAFISASDFSKPAAVIVVVDNSASMGYRYQGDTYLGRGKHLARQVIESLPGGSRVAVVSSDQPAGPAEFMGDKSLAAQRVTDVPLSAGSRPLAGAVNRALELLNTVDMPRKEVLIVTDSTSQAWAESPSTRSTEGVSFVVLNCGGGEGANLSLGAVSLTSGYLPLGTQVVVRTDVRSANLAAQTPVRFDIDGSGVQELTMGLSKGSASTLAASYRAMDAGEHTGVVVLDADDALAIDNTRYFSFQAGPPPEALIVEAAPDQPSATYEAVAQAVAPGGEAQLGQWVQRRAITPAQISPQELADAPVVILPDVPDLGASKWEALGQYVRDGGNLWIVAGPRVSVENYNSPAAQAVVPLVLAPAQQMSSPVGVARTGGADAMLEPFDDKANPPLSQILTRRRLGERVLAVDARSAMLYENDRTPAIVRKGIGRGEVVFWNLCPDREFSNLASLPQFVILAQRTVRLLSAGGQQANQVLVGDRVTLRVPRGMATPLIALRRPGSSADQALSADAASGQVSVPVEQPGDYVVSFTQGQRVVRRVFSANLDVRESDLSVVADRPLRMMFPADQVLLATSVEDLAKARRAVSQPLHLDVPVLLALLALMLAESLLSNRFYRPASQQAVVGPRQVRRRTESAPSAALLK